MPKYELKDFKSWIEKYSTISSQNWNYYFSHFEPTNNYYGRPPTAPRENFEAIAQGRPQSNWNTSQLATLKKWIAEVDEKERISKKITDLEKKLKEESLKSSKISAEKDSKIARLEREKSELNNQLKKLSGILLPNLPFNFVNLEKETKRIMFSETNTSLSLNKIKLVELVANSQEKLSAELRPVLELYLNALAEKNIKEGKLETYEEILGMKLDISDVQNIKKLKKEVLELEKKIASFPQEEFKNLIIQETQTQIPPK